MTKASRLLLAEIEDVTAALLALAEIEVLRERMGVSARKHVEKAFGQERFVGAVRDPLTDFGIVIEATACGSRGERCDT